jgi:hypothetical protein
MSYGNSDKEFYLALYLKLYKEQLEKVLGINLGEIELEKNIRGRKVDLYAITEDNRELYMELQLSKSDSTHLEQVSKIIEDKDINNIILIWGAIEFTSDMMDYIEEKVKVSGKNVKFLALKINTKLINYLNMLNKMFITDIVENLKILNEVDEHFKIKGIFYRLQDENNTVCTKKEKETLDLSRKQDVIKYLLNELRKQVHYYPSIHRDKQLDNGVITLAGGKANIYFMIGLNRRNMLFVELRFSELTKEIFYELAKSEEKINDKLDYMAEFDVVNLKLGTYIYFTNNNREMLIKRLVRTADKYIRCLTQYTFQNGTN